MVYLFLRQVSHQPQESKEEAESGHSEDDSALLSSICYRVHSRSCLLTPSALSRPGYTDTEDRTTNQLPDTSRLRPQDTSKPQINRGERLLFMNLVTYTYIYIYISHCLFFLIFGVKYESDFSCQPSQDRPFTHKNVIWNIINIFFEKTCYWKLFLTTGIKRFKGRNKCLWNVMADFLGCSFVWNLSSSFSKRYLDHLLGGF